MIRKRLEAGQDFPRFLKHVRKEENVLLEQLSKGLMTVSNLARIEKGQRPISKNMRDCLLGRLGIAKICSILKTMRYGNSSAVFCVQ